MSVATVRDEPKPEDSGKLEFPGGWQGGDIDAAAAFLAFPSAVVITDLSGPDNPIVLVNPAFTELTGYAADEVVGRNCRFLQGRGTDPRTVAAVRGAVAAGSPIHCQILNYRKDGRQFWADLAISPIRGRTGALAGFVAAIADITEQKKAEEEKSEAFARLDSVVRNMPGFVWQQILRRDGTLEYLGEPAAYAGGEAGKPLEPLNPFTQIHPLDTDRVRREIDRSIRNVSPLTLEFRTIGPSGEESWFRTSSTPRRMPNGDIVWDGVGVDVTKEKASERRLAGIVENIPGFVFQRVRKADGTIEFPYLSPSLSRLIAHPSQTIATAADLLQRMHPEDLAPFQKGLVKSADELSHLKLEYRLKTNNEEERWFRSYSTPARLPNGDVVWDGVGVDVTSEKLIENQLKFLAYHDALTGLANRAQLTARLSEIIVAARQQRQAITLSNLLLVDFSEINETLGTAEGDAALRGIATRLSELAMLYPNSIVARVGTTEFAMLRRGVGVANDIDGFANVLMRSLSQPILVGDEALMIEPCVGTAFLVPGELAAMAPETAAAELMKQAAIGLSAAVQQGPGTHRVYDAVLDHRTQHRMTLRHSLRRAIEENQFVLHYQPLVDLKTGRISAAEALVRWQHPELGLIRPDHFIPLAEESGLIGGLGEWILRTAMRQVQAWKAEGLVPPRIAVNISAVQAQTPGFLDVVRGLLADTGVDPRQLELELTESMLLQQSPETVAALVQLKNLGFDLVIDDFGAGHASFQYLRNFPIDKIKIDQIFVRQLTINSSDALIIRAIASLAHSLNLALVAEGIETIEQRDFLRDQGCETGQGYFFSLPLAAEDLGWMIRNNVVLPVAAKMDDAGKQDPAQGSQTR